MPLVSNTKKSRFKSSVVALEKRKQKLEEWKTMKQAEISNRERKKKILQMEHARCSTISKKPVKASVFKNDKHEYEIEEVDINDVDFEEEDGGMKDRTGPDHPCMPSTSGRYVRVHRAKNVFKRGESLSLFRFVLNECRVQKPGKEGRVAKKRLPTNSIKFWERFKASINGHKSAEVYRTHFNSCTKHLYKVRGVSLPERVDLYYALDIPVLNDTEKQQIFEMYSLEINELGYITDKIRLDHWDSDSEELDDDDPIRESRRFTELHDGAMWKFIIEKINEEKNQYVYSRDSWEEFRRRHKDEVIITKKPYAVYHDRFRRVLMPNLFLMPIEMETKAALYYILKYPVPEELRESITTKTDAKLLENGFIIDYPSCPSHLNFRPSIKNTTEHIGISSSSVYSTLREPGNKPMFHVIDDRKPYTREENMNIWDFVRSKSVDSNGKLKKISAEFNGNRQTMFWWSYVKQASTERKHYSVAKNFKKLREHIMDTDYDLQTKMELYYVLSQPVVEEAIDSFKTIATIVLTTEGIIRFAISPNFLIGRITDDPIEQDPMKYTYIFDLEVFNQVFGNENDPEPLKDLPPDRAGRLKLLYDIIMHHINRIETQERIEFEQLSNSAKFPYVKQRQLKSSAIARSQREVSTEYDYQIPMRKPREPEDFDVPEIKQEVEEMLEREVKLEPMDENETVWDMVENNYLPTPPSLEEQGFLQNNCFEVAIIDEAIDEIERKMSDFTRVLKERRNELSEEQKEHYRVEIEALSRMFRMAVRGALRVPI